MDRGPAHADSTPPETLDAARGIEGRRTREAALHHAIATGDTERDGTPDRRWLRFCVQR